jgi:hypothetical protein
LPLRKDLIFLKCALTTAIVLFVHVKAVHSWDTPSKDTLSAVDPARTREKESTGMDAKRYKKITALEKAVISWLTPRESMASVVAIVKTRVMDMVRNASNLSSMFLPKLLTRTVNVKAALSSWTLTKSMASAVDLAKTRVKVNMVAPALGRNKEKSLSALSQSSANVKDATWEATPRRNMDSAVEDVRTRETLTVELASTLRWPLFNNPWDLRIRSWMTSLSRTRSTLYLLVEDSRLLCKEMETSFSTKKVTLPSGAPTPAIKAVVLSSLACRVMVI